MCQAFPDVSDLGEIEAKKPGRAGGSLAFEETSVQKSGLQVALPATSLSDVSSQEELKNSLCSAPPPLSKSCFYEPLGSNAHVFTKPATGSAWKKRVQKHSSATQREVKGTSNSPES